MTKAKKAFMVFMYAVCAWLLYLVLTSVPVEGADFDKLPTDNSAIISCKGEQREVIWGIRSGGALEELLGAKTHIIGFVANKDGRFTSAGALNVMEFEEHYPKEKRDEMIRRWAESANGILDSLCGPPGSISLDLHQYLEVHLQVENNRFVTT